MNPAEIGAKDRVFDGSLQERGLEIPDVKDASMDSLTDNDIFKADAPHEQEQQQAQEPEKEYKNPGGRVRWVEKEKRDLEIKIDRLTDVVNNLLAQGQVDTQPDIEPEDDIDPDINPVGFLTRQIEQLRSEIRYKDVVETEKVQQSAYEKAINAANMRIQGGLQQAPEVFKGAIMHLAKILDRNLERKYPNLTYEERLSVANDQINHMKVRWVAEGRDPAREMLETASTYGWNGPAEGPSSPQEPRKADKRGQVRAQRDRASEVASIGGVQGNSPRKVTGKDLKQMDMRTFNYTINEMIRSGDASPGKTIGKTPSFADLLPGKGVNTR